MSDWLAKLTSLRQDGKPAALVTVSEVTGSTPREVGAKMVVTVDDFWGTIGGGRLESLALEDTRKALAAGETKKFRYPLGASAGQCCGGLVEILVEVFPVSPSLYLFGGGHVGQAVCETLQGTPFKIHLVDDREEWISRPSLPKSVVRHACDWEDFAQEAPWERATTYVGIMTHRHDRDEAILRYVLEKPTRYVGLIGSRAKWKRFESRLLARGTSSEQLQRVKCPIGIGGLGKAPKEVAISFSAELLQLYHA